MEYSSFMWDKPSHWDSGRDVPASSMALLHIYTHPNSSCTVLLMKMKYRCSLGRHDITRDKRQFSTWESESSHWLLVNFNNSQSDLKLIY